MKINIPHIGYTVYIKPMPKDAPKGWNAFAEKTSETSATIYINNPSARENFGSLVHETTHVLSFICELRHIDFKYEKEHCAYIMAYIVNTVLGYKIKQS